MILHIYSGNLFGGIETHILALIEADIQRRCSNSYGHHVALCFEGRLSNDLKNMGRPPVKLGKSRFRYPWTIWRARHRLKLAILQLKIKSIVAHAPWSFRLASPVARKLKIPIALWNHDIITGQNQLEKYASKFPPDFIITNSQFTVKGLESHFGRKVDTVIYPVIRFQLSKKTIETRVRIRNEFSTDLNSVVITQFSRFERWKGQTLLLTSLANLKSDPAWTCWIVGGVQKPEEHAFLEELKKLAKSIEIEDRVRFIGQRSDIPDILAATDIHCQPNLAPEPFGLAFVEALAAGRPSVGINYGGSAEIITPECGRLVPPDDLFVLSKTLSDLIHDPKLRDDLGRHGPARANQLCNPLQALEQLEKLLALPVISNHGSRT
jgi:glycosyltransferase involved in cell wall biosynthesis